MNDFIGADDVAVSDCIDAAIKADVAGAAEVDPCSYEDVNAAAKSTLPLNNLLLRSRDCISVQRQSPLL